MPDLRDMPPDPFEDDGVDPFAVRAADTLAHDGVAPNDPRWEHVGGEPTIDDFDAAADEIRACEVTDLNDAEECASGPFTRMLPWLSAIAIVMVVAMVLTYVLR